MAFEDLHDAVQFTHITHLNDFIPFIHTTTMSLPPSDRWTYDMMPPPVENQGTLIRQIEYRAPNQPQDFNRQSMSFKLTNSTRPGIRLSHATDAAVLRLLEQAEEPLPIAMRSKMSIRIQPEGYSTNFSVQKHVKRLVQGRPVVITRAQTVGLVAEVVKAFIDDQAQSLQTQPGVHQFGPGAIELEDLVLVALEQVSVASLQPALVVRDRGLD